MKKKRVGLVLVLMLMLVGNITALAASAYENYNYGSGKNAIVSGYIDFIEGPVTFEDRVNYTASITGTDASKCTAAYEVIVDNKTIRRTILNSAMQSVSESDIKVGYGHEYAKLILDFNGKTKTIVSYAD